MSSSKREKQFETSRSSSYPSVQSDSTRSQESPMSRLEEATKKLFRTSIKAQDRSILNAVAAVQLGPGGMFVPHEQDNQGSAAPSPPEAKRKGLPDFSFAPSQQSWLTMFPHNVAAPAFSTTLSTPGARFENTAQLAYCGNLLRKCLSPSLTAGDLNLPLDPAPHALIDPFVQDEEEQIRVRWLIQRVVEEFDADNLKSSTAIAEVVLLGPSLDKEYHRKLLNCLIAEFESARLLDNELLQGVIQLIQCAGPDYLHPDDLVRILSLLRTRLQDTHQQTAKHPYYLALAISRLLDAMVEGKVKDLSRVVEHEPLSALLGQLKESEDLYLKHQATYALQALLHVPNDETRRQLILRHAGNITMGLLGVTSVCKLDFRGFPEGAIQLYDTTVSALDTGTKMVDGAGSLLETGQGLLASMKGGILSGGRQIWYLALREAQEHVKNGCLADFNRFVFEAPCRRDVEFIWGICQLLREMAVDPLWDVPTRQGAIDFLAELYRNEFTRTPDEGIDTCILNFLRQVSAMPDTAISEHSLSLLQGLENDGSVAKQDLYRGCLAKPLDPYPIKVPTSDPTPSALLGRVLAIPDVEYDLHRLKQQRLGDHRKGVYIPPQAKSSLQAKDDTLFPLMEKVQEFLLSHRQVLLLLGDSGAGKSTFNLELEHTLWMDYKKYGPIPLHIILPTIKEPDQDLIGKRLRYLNFSEAQILEMKLHRQFIVICDGYDESQLRTNLHNTNQFNQPGQWKVKVVISCRSQYLGSDYRARFQPQTASRYDHATDLFQEAAIAPFSRNQVEQYIEQYVKVLPTHDLLQDRPSWIKEEYMDKLLNIPNLLDLVSNPFLLTLSLEALPTVVDPKKDLTTIRITRVQLYDSFVKRWIEVNQARLESSPLSESERTELGLLVDDGFVYQGIRFQKDLAVAIFKEHGGNPVVQYSPLRDRDTWKTAFFSPDGQVKLLRESSTVTRSGVYFRFIHRSLLEYFYSRTICGPVDCETDAASNDRSSTTTLKTSLAQMNIVGEPSILQFLAERVDMDPLFRAQLVDAIDDSKTDAEAGVAAANAISILVRAGSSFSGADLRGIRIPGADLRGGLFDSADLKGADLTDVNMAKAWLRQANLNHARMLGVHFGELPYLNQEMTVARCVFSPNGKVLARSTYIGDISIYNTTTWTRITTYDGGAIIAISPNNLELATGGDEDGKMDLRDLLTGETRLSLSGHDDRVTCISYSPDGSKVASSSWDSTVRIWSTDTGDTLHVLSGHTGDFSGVAFSPSGLRLATCSNDETVRTWDAQTGESIAVLDGHSGAVFSVAYSPGGSQIGSGGGDGTVRLWNAETGELRFTLPGHINSVRGVAFSPDGHQIASCGDYTIRLWDLHTGRPCDVLSGHSVRVSSVAYSPTGDLTASSSWDGTVRLWKAGGGLADETSGGPIHTILCADISPCGRQIVTGSYDGLLQLWDLLTGTPGVEWKGHTSWIMQVAFSPCGELIASASWDKTVRVWGAQTGVALRVFEDHTDSVNSVAFSPTGHQIVSGSDDETARTWDTATGEAGFILEGHTDCVNGVVFSPSGHQIASCSYDMTVRLWCSQTGEQQHVLMHAIGVSQVIYSPDGQYLVSLSLSNDPGNTLCWDPESGQSVHRFLDELNINVLRCSFSPIGMLFAALGDDGRLRLWDVASGKWLDVCGSWTGVSQEGIKWMQGPDCMYLVTSTDKSLRVWKLVERDSICSVQLVWRTGLNELNMEDASMDSVVGLSPANLELMKQRGAIVKVIDS